jgi:ABC-type Mn2+/Zn2+ transport system permease subunit
VIEPFLASWELFRNTYLAGWGIAFLLSLLGVFVVARDQIFLGAAVSQASTFGVAFAIWLGGLGALHGLGWIHGELFQSLLAVAFSLLATLVTTRGGRERGESHEAITGWVFLVSGSGAILLMAHSPHGLEEIHRLLASTLIGATAVDVIVFAGLSVVSAALLSRFYRPFLLLSVDHTMAVAVGMRATVWNVVGAIWLGAAIGLSIRVSGMLYTFGCLVLPALAARSVVREMRGMLLLSPILALAASSTGFVIANAYDYPPAQTTVGLLCVTLAVAWVYRRARRLWGTA